MHMHVHDIVHIGTYIYMYMYTYIYMYLQFTLHVTSAYMYTGEYTNSDTLIYTVHTRRQASYMYKIYVRVTLYIGMDSHTCIATTLKKCGR